MIYSDSRYVMPSITIAERRAALGRAPVHLYYFRWETPVEGGRRMTPHALEISFAFDNTRTSRFTRDSDTAIALADKVSDTWIAFARTGNPDYGKLPTWKPYDTVSRNTLVINNDSALMSDPIQAEREIMQPILNL